MFTDVVQQDREVLNRRLMRSLFLATDVVDHISKKMYEGDNQWQRTILGHTFTLSRASCDSHEATTTLVHTVRTWLQAHEEAQIMLASILVVVGLWWLVRAVFALIINLVCPLIVVLLAVILVPQLRTPLLGQNYPALANLIGNILTKMAENIKQE